MTSSKILSGDSIRKKLERLQPTQESVETVSLWCLHHKDNAAAIVSAWTQIYKATETDKQRLSLFYLANDICQKAKKKKAHGYLNNFVPALKEAILLSRFESIKQNIDRILNIWSERGVFEPGTINELKGILETSKSSDDNGTSSTAAKESSSGPSRSTESDAIMSEFNLSNLINETERHQRSVDKVEHLRVVLPSTSVASGDEDGSMKSMLKSRQEGQKFIDDLNETHRRWSEFVDEYERRMKRHHQLVIALERAQIFYETQLNEADIVQKAYDKFGTGVKAVRQRLMRMQKLGIYDYLSTAIQSQSPRDDSFSETLATLSGSLTGPKSSDQMESVDMDLDDEVKFSGVPNPLRAGVTQEAGFDGMKLATNQSFLHDTPPSNGASTNAEVPSKKPKLDPRQFQKPQPLMEIPSASSGHLHFSPNAMSATLGWPSTADHHQTPANVYPAPHPFGSGINAAPTPISPPPFLAQSALGHYQLQQQQQHSAYGIPLPPPPPPPPQQQSTIPSPLFGPPRSRAPPPFGNPAMAGDMGSSVFDYDHGGNASSSSNAYQPSPQKHRTPLVAELPIHHEARSDPSRLFHPPPESQYYNEQPTHKHMSGGSNNRYNNRPSSPNAHQHYQPPRYSPMNRGHHGHPYGRGGGRV